LNNVPVNTTSATGAEQDARSFAHPPRAHTAVLFDLDGTLLDSIELIVQSYAHAVTTHVGGPVDRDGVDAFSNPVAAPLLEALAPDRVVVYGVALEVCDRYAVEGMLALDAGFEIVVVQDAVAALDQAKAVALFQEWRQRGVRITSTDRVVGAKAAAS